MEIKIHSKLWLLPKQKWLKPKLRYLSRSTRFRQGFSRSSGLFEMVDDGAWVGSGLCPGAPIVIRGGWGKG